MLSECRPTLSPIKHETFYSTAAQVIPVLWIVLVFQLRLFGRKAEEDGATSVEADEQHRSASTLTLVLIAGTGLLLWTGEGTALNSLLKEEDTGFARGLVSLALTMGTLFVFFIPVFPWVEALLERTPLEPLRQRWFRRVERRRNAREKNKDPPDAIG